MAKRRKKTRRKTSYAPKRRQPAPAPSRPKEEGPAPRPAAQTSGQRPARRSGAARPAYAGRTAARLAAMDLEKDEVMYAYVRKDLMRIGIFSAIMFGSLIVLKLLGVG